MLRIVSTRREWLRLGGLAGLGLTWGHGLLPRLSAAPAPAALYPGFGKARSVIVIFTSGGQSQLETWDPKPDAPEEVRGAFRTIASSIPGVLVGEHLPHLARLAHLYTIVRSLSHDDLDHGTAIYLALTGRFHTLKSANPLPRPDDVPTLGAVVKRVQPTARFPYSAVHVNGPLEAPELPAPGQFSGLLGRECEPLILGDVSQSSVAVPGLSPLAELPPVRLEARRSLLQALENHCRQMEQQRAMLDKDTLYRQAYALLSSPQCQRAFDLGAEPASVRDRYGRYRSGQACLLARRLVEAGVPLITVMFNHGIRGQDKTPELTESYGWDTHNDIFEALRVHLLPRFDWSFSALLEDLEERGLLKETLVICMGEFGRAPRVALEPKFTGQSPGRKHWASVYSIVCAGAGVARGAVYGASDKQAAYPKSAPVYPWDVAATLFSALGIDPAGHYDDPHNRPYPISIGSPVAGLYR